jgi:hypothetical protein
MNGIRLSGFPLSPDPSPTAIGALSDDLFTNARPAAAYSNGTLHILGKTVSGRVVDGVAGGVGPVSTWTPVAVMPLITGGLGVANRDTDRIDLLARSASGPVVHAWFSQGSWVSSELIGGSFDEDVLGVWDMGALQLYGVALGYVFHKSGFEGDWQSQDISGNITSACAAVAPGDGTMDLLARLPNGHLGHKTYVNGWVDGFPDLGLPIPGEPSAIAAAGAIHVFARNPDGSIWHAHFPREPGAGMGPPAPSTTFHRLLHDDPPGGCNTRDYSGEGDWYPNYCKTECAAPAIGISSSFAGRGSCAMAGAEIPSLDPPSAQSDDPDETFEEFTHLLACNNNHSPGIVVGSGYTLHFETSDDQPSPNVGYDWASGLRKGECDNSSAIVGVASDQYWHGDGTCFLAYGIVGALCSTLMSPPGTVAAASNCQVVDFTNDSANEAGGGTSWVGADWDYKFHKGQCGDGRYIKGIAHPQLGAGSARATKILCCSAQYVPSP